MAVSYGFYNSVGGDRLYNAIQMSSLFDGLIYDGVFMAVGDALDVSNAPVPGLSVVVGTGRAWFNHTWTLNDSDLVLPISAPHQTYARYDAIVLEIDASDNVRANSIKVIEGTPAPSPVWPTLTNTELVHTYPLAYISVPVGVTAITSLHIANMVGSGACPYVTGVVQTMNTDNLLAQWGAEWNAWTASATGQFYTWFAGLEVDWDDWMTVQQAEFIAWFDAMKGQLTTDAAANIQLQINGMRPALSADRNYYVRLDGNDANTGLVDNAGGAFLTIQKAIDVATLYDLKTYNITINVAQGIYNIVGPILLKPFIGSGMITIVSNPLTTTSLTIQSDYTNGGCFKTTGYFGHYKLEGLKLTSTSGIGIAIEVTNKRVVNLKHINFGNYTNGTNISIAGGIVNVEPGGFQISGSSNIFCKVIDGGVIYSIGNVVQIMDYYTINTWLDVSLCGVAHMYSLTYFNEPSITGKRYNVTKNGVINTNGAAADYLPGTIAGTTATGGQYT